MTHDPKCPRCGCTLRIETVKIPVYAVRHYAGGERHSHQYIERYEEREEVSDCPRCTGSY